MQAVGDRVSDQTGGTFTKVCYFKPSLLDLSPEASLRALPMTSRKPSEVSVRSRRLYVLCFVHMFSRMRQLSRRVCGIL